MEGMAPKVRPQYFLTGLTFLTAFRFCLTITNDDHNNNLTVPMYLEQTSELTLC